MARVVRFHETGGPEVLRIEELDVKAPAPGEVQIAVKAIGLNSLTQLVGFCRLGDIVVIVAPGDFAGWPKKVSSVVV